MTDKDKARLGDAARLALSACVHEVPSRELCQNLMWSHAHIITGGQ